MVTGHPMYSRFETTVTLPDGGAGFSVAGTDADVEAAGYRHWREVRFDEDVLRVVRETRTLRAEIDEADRAAAVEPLDRVARNVVEVIAPRDYTPTPGDEDAWAADTPETADDVVDRALLLTGQEMYAEAFALLDQALAREPDNANLIANRGIVHLWADDLEAAAADFDHAGALDPNEVVMLNGKGMLALRRDRHREAIAWFNRAMERGTDEAYILNLRAQAHAALGDEAATVADVRSRMALRPEDPAPALEGLMILVDAGMSGPALTLIDELAQAHPDQADVREALARNLDWLGEHERALQMLEDWMAGREDDARLRVWRARLRYLTGDMTGGDADAAFVRAAAENQTYLWGPICGAQAVAAVNLPQALADCEAHVESDETLTEAPLWHGLVLLQLDRPEEALERFSHAQDRFNEVLGEDAAPQTALYGQGLARVALGQTEEGERDMAAALRRSRTSAIPFRTYEARTER